MKNYLPQITGLIIVGMVLLVGCGGGNQNSKNGKAGTAKNQSGLSEFQQVNGIGPVTETLELEAIDASLVEKGEKIFESKCSACHKLNDRYVGPPLGDVLESRTPAFVMNMILNPDQMVKEHPVAKKMLAEYMTPMPNQNLSREEARAVVEFLRKAKNEELSSN